MQYFSSVDVEAAMPPVGEQLQLAEHVLRRLGHGSPTTGVVAVHPRAAFSIAYALPAFAATAGTEPVYGASWITSFPGNLAIGIPTMSGLIVLNDPATSEPVAILEGARITSAGIAAMSAVSIRQLLPDISGRPALAAIIGAGVQGHAQLAPLGQVLPGVRLAVFDVRADRARELAKAARSVRGIGSAYVASSARRAVAEADVVITATSLGPTRQRMTNDWLAGEVLVVALDDDNCVSAEIAQSAIVFLVDDSQDYSGRRREGGFEGYPAASGSIGDALITSSRWPGGRILATHLGVGLMNVALAARIRQRALEVGKGTNLLD